MCKTKENVRTYVVSIPCGNKTAYFEATNVKESEGGFFATIQNEGGRARYFYSYKDGADYYEAPISFLK